MAKQIPLPFEQTGGKDGFLVTASIRGVIDQLSASPRWPYGSAVLVGPPASGKSRIGAWFASHAGGDFIDDAEARDDAALFHAWNLAHQAKRPILFASRQVPADWAVTLPDLRSRLGASLLIAIPAPDEEMREALLRGALQARGLLLSDALIDYALARLDRGWAAPGRFAGRLDHLGLEQGAAIGQKLVREALETEGGGPESEEEAR